MNRYTFKARRKDNQKWVYGSLIIEKSSSMCLQEYGIPFIETYYIYAIEDENNHYSKIEIKKGTLCQCTGLQDIEGNYIFENDILQVPLFIEDNQKAMCIYNQENNVNNIIGFGLYTYDNYHQRYSNLVQSDEWDEFKIIGNKFDNVKE